MKIHKNAQVYFKARLDGRTCVQMMSEERLAKSQGQSKGLHE